MKISVKIKTRSKNPGVDKLGVDEYQVSVKEPASAGQANEAVIRSLAKFFKVPSSSVRIVIGKKNKKKVIEII